MAKRQITQLVDDLDGAVLVDGGVTIRFALEGRSYDIDLSDANAEKLRDILAPYIAAGRAISGSARARTKRNSPADLKAVREWAKEHGYTVSERGRVPAHVLDAYAAR